MLLKTNHFTPLRLSLQIILLVGRTCYPTTTPRTPSPASLRTGSPQTPNGNAALPFALGQNPPPALMTHLARHLQRCVTDFRGFPATHTNKSTSRTNAILLCARKDASQQTQRPPWTPFRRKPELPPLPTPSKPNFSSRRPLAPHLPETQSQFRATPIESVKIGFVPSFCPHAVPRTPLWAAAPKAVEWNYPLPPPGGTQARSPVLV